MFGQFEGGEHACSNAKSPEENAKYAAQRKAQVGTGERSEKIRTYNFPQNRVTDHRIELTLYNLANVIDGDLDGLIEPLIANALEEKLGSLKQISSRVLRAVTRFRGTPNLAPSRGKNTGEKL